MLGCSLDSMFSNLGEYYSWEFSSTGWKCDCDQIYQKCWNSMATPTWNDTYISPEWSKHNWQVTKLWSLRWVFLSISLPCLNTITVVAYALPCITTTSQKSLYLIVNENQFSNDHVVSAWRNYAPSMDSGENKQALATFFLKLTSFSSFQVVLCSRK